MFDFYETGALRECTPGVRVNDHRTQVLRAALPGERPGHNDAHAPEGLYPEPVTYTLHYHAHSRVAGLAPY